MRSKSSRPPNRINPRWFIAGLLVLATFVLGFVGFHQYFVQRNETRGGWDLLYLTLQLFTIESGAVEPPVPLTLQLARFFGAAASIYAVLLTLIELFSGHLSKTLIRLFGGHVVVCGLGRKGERLVEQLRAAGWRVVVIEPNESNPHLDRCRELGCYVIVGRANDEWELQKAFVSRAAYLLCLTGDDGINVETAVRAHQLVQGRQGEHLRCVAHVSDPQLQTMLLQHGIFAAHRDPFDLEFVNTYELAARVMGREAEAVLADLPQMSADVHYLIVGLGHFGEALLRRMIKDWHLEHAAQNGKLRVTVADFQAAQREQEFNERFGEVPASVEVTFEQCDIHDQRQASALIQAANKRNEGTQAAFICIDDDSKASYAALAIRRELPSDVPIYVRMTEEAGLATLLGTKESGDGVIENVRAIGLLDIGCNVELLIHGTREALAQAIHQGYVQDQRAAGKTIADNPSIRPWHRLSPDLQESNRRQADHIYVKLAAIDCELVARPAGFTELLEFTPEEIERLAALEHKRWLKQKLAEGWTPGPKRSEALKTNPSLVAWEELSEEVQGYNRDAIRRIPKILARSDFEIRRRG